MVIFTTDDPVDDLAYHKMTKNMEQYLLHTAGSSLLTSSGGPVCDGRKILSEGSRFEVFDRIICKTVGKLVSSGQITYNGGVRALKALMYENQMRLFNLQGEINE